MISRKRRVLMIVLAPFVCVLLLWLSCFVWVAGLFHATPPSRADAAVVLGAAVWANGRPSPVFARRIHATGQLYKQGLVAWIGTTGGVGVGKHGPSEGDTAQRVLVQEEGIPPDKVLVENTSHTTWENLYNLAPSLRAHGVRTLLIVSDGYHLARAVRMAEDLGFDAWGVAADGTRWQSVRNSTSHWFRETNLLFVYLFQRPFL